MNKVDLPVTPPSPPASGYIAFLRHGRLCVMRPDGSVLDVELMQSTWPAMLELLRDAGKWYCGEMPDGTDRRAAIAALLARIDAAPPVVP